MEARVSFSDRFKKQTAESLSPREKGRLRWARLKEAEATGELDEARDRFGLGRIIGGLNDGTAYSYVSNLIHRGYIKETFVGEHERRYTLVEEPDFDYKKTSAPSRHRKRKRNRATSEGIAQREQRVAELAEHGELSRARNKGELVRMMALPTKYHILYNWVDGRIKQGWLKEEQIGEDSFGTPIYKYTLLGKPTAEVRTDKEDTKPDVEPEVVDDKEPVPSFTGAVVGVTKGDLNIRVTFVNVKDAGELVKQLLKGE